MKELLIKLNACKNAREWAEGKDWKEVFETCHRGDWLLWLHFRTITDMINGFGDESVIYSWMRNRNTLEYLGLWETMHNMNFKPIEFDRFRKDAGLNTFTMSPKKWIDATGAIGIVSKAVNLSFKQIIKTAAMGMEVPVKEK